MLDLRGLVCFILLLLLAAVGLSGASVTINNHAPPKKAEPDAEPPPRRPLLPRRPTRELAALTLQEPVAYWDGARKQFITTAWRPFAGKAEVGGTTSPDGAEEIAVDLPREFHLKNKGGTDGAGLCVWCSIQHASVWQHVKQTAEIFAWMQKRTGGGWPQRVDELLPKISAERGLPTPEYVQVQNKDLEVLKLACKTGRMPGITYNFSPTGRYGGQRIAHMVSLAHASDRWFCVLDNNFPGTYEWMDPQTFLKVYAGNGNGWAVIFKDPGPPPPPKN